ncbi:MAG: hypothetical protein K0R55_3360 [Sporomusa sp.]|nr:hypothetical protein [Sporomusa sp.]
MGVNYSEGDLGKSWGLFVSPQCQMIAKVNKEKLKQYLIYLGYLLSCGIRCHDVFFDTKME